jgi:hypothetical protein
MGEAKRRHVLAQWPKTSNTCSKNILAGLGLPSAQKTRATVEIIGGPVYFGPKPASWGELY